MAHTPGPWRIALPISSNMAAKIQIRGRCEGYCLPGPDIIIASIGDRWIPDQMDNARLIVAAPDLKAYLAEAAGDYPERGNLAPWIISARALLATLDEGAR